MPSWRSDRFWAPILPSPISGEAPALGRAYNEAFSSFAAKEEQ